LTFIANHSQIKLSASLVQILWDSLVLNRLQLEQEIGIGIVDSLISNGHVDTKVCVDVLTSLFPQLDFRNLTESAFFFYRRLFLLVNGEANKITDFKLDVGWTVIDSELFGILNLWKIAFVCFDQTVRDRVLIFLHELLTEVKKKKKKRKEKNNNNNNK